MTDRYPAEMLQIGDTVSAVPNGVQGVVIANHSGWTTVEFSTAAALNYRHGRETLILVKRAPKTPETQAVLSALASLILEKRAPDFRAAEAAARLEAAAKELEQAAALLRQPASPKRRWTDR